VSRISICQERRQSIARAAWELIGEKGIAATTMRDIAQRAGVSLGVVNHFFENRQDVIDAALAGACETYVASVEELCGESRRPEEVLRSVLWAGLPYSPEQENWARSWLDFWSHASREPALREVINNTYDTWRDAIADAVRGAQVTGEVNSGIDADLLAKLIAAVTDGLLLHAVLNPQAFPPADMERLTNLFLAILRSAGSDSSKV